LTCGYWLVPVGYGLWAKPSPHPEQRQGPTQQPRSDGQAVTGGGNSRVSEADMGKMQEMLTPGTAALIVVVPEPLADDVTNSIGEADTHVLEADLPPPQQ
jgi:hypothetical protein